MEAKEEKVIKKKDSKKSFSELSCSIKGSDHCTNLVAGRKLIIDFNSDNYFGITRFLELIGNFERGNITFEAFSDQIIPLIGLNSPTFSTSQIKILKHVRSTLLNKFQTKFEILPSGNFSFRRTEKINVSSSSTSATTTSSTSSISSTSGLSMSSTSSISSGTLGTTQKGKTSIVRNDEILESIITRTGNLTPTLFIDVQEKIDSIVYNNITIKIYPLELHKNTYYEKLLRQPPTDHKPTRNELDENNRFNNAIIEHMPLLMEFLFWRESLLNCYVKNYIITPKIAGTFLCINDVFIAKGLPINDKYFKNKITEFNSVTRLKKWITATYNIKKDKKELEKDAKEEKKKQPTDNIPPVLKDLKYGFIEMEKVPSEWTLHNLATQFDLGIMFELLYTKLCLSFICNIYLMDDHFANILVNTTQRIRKYNITRRKTTYTFYITNNYSLKFIDLERFKQCTDRNLVLDANTDIMFSERSEAYFKIIPSRFQNMNERNVAEYLLNNIIHHNLLTVDSFAQTLYRILPPQYTQYEKVKEKYGLIMSATLEKDLKRLKLDPVESNNKDRISCLEMTIKYKKEEEDKIINAMIDEYSINLDTEPSSDTVFSGYATNTIHVETPYIPTI